MRLSGSTSQPQQGESSVNEKNNEAEKENNSGSDKTAGNSSEKKDVGNDKPGGPDIKIDSVEKYQKEKTLSEYNSHFNLLHTSGQNISLLIIAPLSV